MGQLGEDAVARRGQRDAPGVQPPRLRVPDPLQRRVDGRVPLHEQGLYLGFTWGLVEAAHGQPQDMAPSNARPLAEGRSFQE